MLQSFQKAYSRNAFPYDDPCTVSLEVIEKYMQILLPAYQFNLIMQLSNSTIGDVLPALQIMISKWSRMNVTGVYKSLCRDLIASFSKNLSTR